MQMYFVLVFVITMKLVLEQMNNVSNHLISFEFNLKLPVDTRDWRKQRESARKRETERKRELERLSIALICAIDILDNNKYRFRFRMQYTFAQVYLHIIYIGSTITNNKYSHIWFTKI